MSRGLDVSGEAVEFRLFEAGLAANRINGGCRRCEQESSGRSKRIAARRVGESVVK